MLELEVAAKKPGNTGIRSETYLFPKYYTDGKEVGARSKVLTSASNDTLSIPGIHSIPSQRKLPF